MDIFVGVLVVFVVVFPFFFFWWLVLLEHRHSEVIYSCSLG